MSNEQIILFLLNGLLGLVMLVCGAMINNLFTAVKDLRAAHKELDDKHVASDRRHHERLDSYVHKEEFKEWRDEQRGWRDEQRRSFQEITQKIDGVKDQLAKKADRSEPVGRQA